MHASSSAESPAPARPPSPASPAIRMWRSSISPPPAPSPAGSRRSPAPLTGRMKTD